MQIPYREQRRLRQIERTLRRSDPHLAAMLGIFAQLCVGESLTGPEQQTGVRRQAWLFARRDRLKPPANIANRQLNGRRRDGP